MISAPHAHDHSSVNRVMLHVCLALIPCTAYSIYLFGYAALNLFCLTILSSVLWESLCLKLRGVPQTQLHDHSALLTGWLLALTLPPWAPYWIAIGGSFIAIVIGKQLYGGLGQNLFNPAMLARVALLISFPVQMTTWPLPSADWTMFNFIEGMQITAGLYAVPDSVTGATALGHLKTELSAGGHAVHILQNEFSALAGFLGNLPGSLGETSALLILLGGCWLLLMRIISWHIPLSMLITVAVLAAIFHAIEPARYAPPSFHLLTGGLMLGAFFIATDLVTSPSSKGGQLVFGTGCGATVFVIRTWGNFPEGVAFAVLFMNALTPLIDLYLRPRIYGRTRKGTPAKTSYTSKTDTE